MHRYERITRRDFLRIIGVNAAAAALPMDWFEEPWPPAGWPQLRLVDLPEQIRAILAAVPVVVVGQDGYSRFADPLHKQFSGIPLAMTRWNRENDRLGDRLYSQIPWGIVLHWFGDRENFDRTVRGYLRGFDSLRQVGDYLTRTSAHFLIGDAPPASAISPESQDIGILQTQKPYQDGNPLVASHLSGLSGQAHQEKRQYFVRALYQLGAQRRQISSILQEFYDGPRMDPNMRTLAVEITGHDFDRNEHPPSTQKIANTVAVVCGLMRRYGVRALDLLGHNEIQLGKPDPGKLFMALIRYLVGVKALLDGGDQMKHLIFGPFLDGKGAREAVAAYFEFVRDYLIMVSTPCQVFRWEKSTGYWNLIANVRNRLAIPIAKASFWSPVRGDVATNRYSYLNPHNHEGLDFTRSGGRAAINAGGNVYLAGAGTCLYLGESGGCQPGQSAIFRHILSDGSCLLSLYSHLQELAPLRVGSHHPAGRYLGKMGQMPSGSGCFLHFATAYGATWETDLRHRPSIPANAGPTWIRQRFCAPDDFLNGLVE